MNAPLRPLDVTHATAFAVRYAEQAAASHAQAAGCVARGSIEPARRHQSDAAYFAGQALKYRRALIGAGHD